MTGQTYVFGGQPAQPSMVSYSALALTGATELQWPWVDQDTDQAVPLYLYVTPTGAFSITMPDATGAANGQAVIVFNVGPSTITILDNIAGAITTIDAGIAKYIILRDNSTIAGTWQALTFGAGTNAADAASLAGYGLSALSGATLNSNNPVVPVTANATATAAYRAQVFEVTAATGAGTMSFDPVGSLGNGWWMGFSNMGSGAWTLDPNGADLIDSQSTITLNPTETCLIFSSGSALYTIGRGRSVDFVYTALNKNVAGNTDVTLTSTEASNLLINLFGALTGNIDLIVPSVVNEYMVRNTTSGSFTITVKTASGAGIVATQGEQAFIKCDGTDCFNVVTNIPTTGTSSMPDGSASLPGLAFQNEVTTGFFRASAGVMGISVLGSQIFGLTASAVTAYQNLAVVSTDAGATVAPLATLFRNSASPAASDIIGGLNFDGNNSTPAQKTYASIQTTIIDKTAASEDATLDFLAVVAGALAKRGGFGQGFMVGGATDGGAGTVSLASTAATMVSVVQTDAGAALGPVIKLSRNSASPATNDLLGGVQLVGKDSGGNDTIYGQINGVIFNATDGSEGSQIQIQTQILGTLSAGNQMMVQGGNITLTATDNGATPTPQFTLVRLSSSPAANDTIGFIDFVGQDSAANQQAYAFVTGYILDPTSGSEDGAVSLDTVVAGAGPAARLTVAQGLYMTGATGGDKGVGTINAAAVYINGALLTYETAPLTPTLLFGGANVGMTGTFTGSYTRIGNRVDFEFSILLSAKGSSTGVATVTGLPYAAIATSQPVCITWNTMSGLSGAAACRVNSGATTLSLRQTANNGDVSISDAVFTNTSLVLINGSYEAA